MGPGLWAAGEDITELLPALRTIIVTVLQYNGYSLRRPNSLRYAPFIDEHARGAHMTIPVITINVTHPIRATIRGYAYSVSIVPGMDGPGFVFALEDMEFAIGNGGFAAIFDTLTSADPPQMPPGMRVAGAAINRVPPTQAPPSVPIENVRPANAPQQAEPLGVPVERDRTAEHQMAFQAHQAGMISQDALMEMMGITIDENQVRHIDSGAEMQHDTSPEQLEAIEERRRLDEAERTFGRSLRAIDIETD